jgi:hypothetical protein
VQPVDTLDDRQVSSSAAAAAEVLNAYPAQPEPARRIAVFESLRPLAVINRHIGLMKRKWPLSFDSGDPHSPARTKQFDRSKKPPVFNDIQNLACRVRR